MTRGYIMVAMGEDYVKQAYLCAKSIIATQSIKNVSLVTSDKVPAEYKSVFDKIIEVPWHSKDEENFYHTEHRWKVFHVTPYEETVVLDTDMLFLSDVSHWWKYASQKSIGFITDVIDYRGNTVTSDYYRKAFTANNLPNVYCAFHYFKKDEIALNFYKTLNTVCENYEKYYKIYSPKHAPKVSSMDINYSITLLDCDINDYAIDIASFVHMKSKIQGWYNRSGTWTDTVPYYMDEDLKLKIGNYLQHGVFHYTENSFCNNIVEKYGK